MFLIQESGIPSEIKAAQNSINFTQILRGPTNYHKLVQRGNYDQKTNINSETLVLIKK